MAINQLTLLLYLAELAYGHHWRILITFVLDKPSPFLEETLEGTARAVFQPSLTRLELFLLPPAIKQHSKARHTALRIRKHFAKVSVFELQRPISVKRAEAACDDWGCDFLFFITSNILIHRPRVIPLLTQFNLSIIAPYNSASALLFRPSPLKGLALATNLKYVCLMRSDILKSLKKEQDLQETVENMTSGHTFISTASDITILQRDEFTSGLQLKRHTGELWQVFANPAAWEERYLHPLYRQALQKGEFETPCPDVYWIPLFSKLFCHHLRLEMEHFGLWSAGNAATGQSEEADNRRVEVLLPYATVDIYMWQIDFNTEYMWILRKYLYPVQLHVYPQHFDYPYSEDNFVIRYRLGEQVKLASHFDEAQISLNVALSDHGDEYEGGGTYFIRYNCSVVKTRKGWGLLHPNRPTHRHLGLELTRGTRYILVSFLDGKQYVQEHGHPSFDHH